MAIEPSAGMPSRSWADPQEALSELAWNGHRRSHAPDGRQADSLTEVLVNHNRTTLVLPLAGLLVVAAAGAAFATSGDRDSSTDTIVIPAAESASPDAGSGTTTTPDKPKDTVLTDVLDDLVAKGTITDGPSLAAYLLFTLHP